MTYFKDDLRLAEMSEELELVMEVRESWPSVCLRFESKLVPGSLNATDAVRCIRCGGIALLGILPSIYLKLFLQ